VRNIVDRTDRVCRIALALQQLGQRREVRDVLRITCRARTKSAGSAASEIAGDKMPNVRLLSQRLQVWRSPSP
jgi:hypothetical protein